MTIQYLGSGKLILFPPRTPAYIADATFLDACGRA